jgi:hypothetical protein
MKRQQLAEIITLVRDQPFVTAGLTVSPDTLNYTVPSGGAGIYTVRVQLTEVPVSGVSMIVKQNASTVYTAATLSPTQIAQQFTYSQLYAAADVIGVVLSSSTAIDLVANNVKATISVSLGL